MWRMHVTVSLRQQTHHTGGVGWAEEFTCVYSTVSVFQFAGNIPTFRIILQYAHINDKNRTEQNRIVKGGRWVGTTGILDP